MVGRGPGEAGVARWNQTPKLLGPLWGPGQRGVRDAAKLSGLETGRTMMSLTGKAGEGTSVGKLWVWFWCYSLISWGNCTWMKYLRQEPIVARIRRQNPQPVAHTTEVPAGLMWRGGVANRTSPVRGASEVKCVHGQLPCSLERGGVL